FWQKPRAVARSRLPIAALYCFPARNQNLGWYIQRFYNLGQQLDWTRTYGRVNIRGVRVVANKQRGFYCWPGNKSRKLARAPAIRLSGCEAGTRFRLRSRRQHKAWAQAQDRA